MSPATSNHVHIELKAEDPECKVCGGLLMEIKYGVNACTACTSFFQRRIKRKENLLCAKESNCVINTKTRSDCLACRLQKCYKMGMNNAPVVISPESSLNSSLENLLRLFCADKGRKIKSLGAKIERHKSAMRRAIFEGFLNPESRNAVIKHFSDRMTTCQMLSLRVQVVRLYAFDRNVFHKDGCKTITLPKKILRCLKSDEIENLIKNNIIRRDGVQTEPEQAAEVPQQKAHSRRTRSTHNDALFYILLSTIKKFHEVMKKKKK
ncbi:hypothetical protein CRE_31314 [Caenorhabditis remanei]|uniref:Nuclear receptor domain-containing protein n=1 Tax=Caenorhabditis remanei TaxID=31234 RepID=E3MLT4_CAERE|nr:hypothetical protein CRE_31314 [Caenorhabditis remanei]